MHPIIKAYLHWLHCFKRSISDVEWSRQDHEEKQRAWDFFEELCNEHAPLTR